VDQSSKEDIRTRLLIKRRGLSVKTHLAKSAAISKRLQESRLFQAAQCIHLYLSNKDEVATTFLIQEAFLQKKKVVVPVVDTHKKMFFSALHSLDTSVLECGPFGIRQPKSALQKHIATDEIDLWIVPGVAFDIMGGRLGYGGGYYDRALAQSHTSIIAIAFDLQLVADPLPLAQRDVAVDLIFTETRTINCEENRRVSKYH